MTDRVIAIDYDRCTGCRICELACSIFNHGESNPVKARIRIVKIGEETESLFFPVVCMKCGEPACKAVCPMGAISDDRATGARRIDEDKCIACSACVYACPFGAIAVDRLAGRSFTCSHCEGDPACVEFCPTGTVQYLEGEEVSMRLGRSALERHLNSVSREEVLHKE